MAAPRLTLAAAFATAIATASAQQSRWLGRVVGPDGAPAAAAGVVHVLDRHGRTLTTAAIDDDGRFAARADTRADALGALVADVPGFALAVSSTWDGGGATIQLAPPHRLRGRVRAPDGAPVAGARVVLRRLAADFRIPLDLGDRSSATSADDGSFSLRGAAAPGYQRVEVEVTARLDGAPHAARVVAELGTEDAALADAVVRRVVPVSGRVVDAVDGAPIAEVDVHVFGFSTLPHARTDAEGAFAVNFVPPIERPQIVVVPRDRERYVQQTITYQAPREPDAGIGGAEGVEGLRVPLRRLVAARGRVVDADGLTAPVVPVEISGDFRDDLGAGWVQTGGVSYGDTGAQMRAADHGVFAARLPIGPARVRVRGPARPEARRKAYDQTFDIDVPVGGHKNLLLTVRKRPGVLVRLEPEDPDQLRGVGGQLIVSVTRGDSTFQYADRAPVWFYPVQRWGDRVLVDVVWRTEDGNEQMLAPTEIVADPKTWPTRLSW